MPRKVSGLPTRIWSFRIKKITSSMEDLDRQYQLAHDYQNSCIAVELERRKKFRSCRSAIPEYAMLEVPVRELEKQLDGVRWEIRRLRQESRKRVDTPELNLKAAAIKAELLTHRKKLSEMAKSLKNDMRLLTASRIADEEAHEALLALNHEFSVLGLSWGTRGLVNQAVMAARRSESEPRLHPWSHDGRIGIQLQGKAPGEELKESGRLLAKEQADLRQLRKDLGKDSPEVKKLTEKLKAQQEARYKQKSPDNRGLPIQDLGADTRLQLFLPPASAYQPELTRRGDRRRAARTTGKIRIGTDSKRSPIWVSFSVILHRQLPVDGVIKWAWIKRSMLGTHEVYYLQLVIEAASFEEKMSLVKREEAIALDVGWRVREKNQLRVGYALDSKGRFNEILLPKTVVERLNHADSLRGIQDKAFDEFKKKFVEWISINEDILPPWFKDTFQFFVQSKSSKRLAWNVREWSKRRFAGDSLIYDEAVIWRRQYLHLYEWEVNERAGALAERKNFFCHEALKIAKNYKNLVLEEFKLTKIVENSQPEEEEDNPQTQRHNRVMASISEFRQILQSTCSAWKCAISTVSAAYTTLDCYACHGIGNNHPHWDTSAEIIHTCKEKCGSTWDQDYNAAANILGKWLKGNGTSRAA